MKRLIAIIRYIFTKTSFSFYLATLILIAFFITIGIFIGNEIQFFKINEKLIDYDYDKQISLLTKTEDDIYKILDFIYIQKKNLRITENNVNSLKQEYEKLNPVVQTNKSTIETIFKMQDERNKTNVWLERTFGFIIGIIASLIASIIFYIVHKKVKKIRIK